MFMITRAKKSHRGKDTYSWGKEEVKTLMENCLIRLVAEAEALEKLVCKMHHFMHPNIIFLQTLSTVTIKIWGWGYGYGWFRNELE